MHIFGGPTDFARFSLIFYLTEILASRGMTPTDFIHRDHDDGDGVLSLSGSAEKGAGLLPFLFLSRAERNGSRNDWLPNVAERSLKARQAIHILDTKEIP